METKTALAPSSSLAARVRQDLGVALLAGIAIFALASGTVDIPSGYDAYRHVKMAWRLLNEGLASVMQDPWHIPDLWAKPVDPYFGFHVLLAPFTLLFELTTAVKVFGSSIFAGTVFVLLRILHHFDAEARAAWVMVAVAGSAITLHRQTVSRPFVLAIFMVLLVTLLTLQKKPMWVGIASAIHAATYSMFFLVAMAPGIWLLLRRDRAAFRLAVSCGVGMAVGVLSNPYFPENLYYVLVNAGAPETAAKAGVEIGTELLPMNIAFVQVSLPVFLVWLASLWVRVKRWPAAGFGGARDVLLILSIGSLIGSIRVGRTFDFFVPFAVLYAAVELTPWVKTHRRQAANAMCLIGLFCVGNVLIAMEANRRTTAVAKYRDVSAYLRQHAKNELVINAKSSDYYYLYYWNSESKYFIGIEPTFVYLHAPEKYWTWRHLSDDQPATCNVRDCAGAGAVDVLSAVTGRLDSQYLLTQHTLHPKLEAALNANSAAHPVFRDSYLTLYKLDR